MPAYGLSLRHRRFVFKLSQRNRQEAIGLYQSRGFRRLEPKAGASGDGPFWMELKLRVRESDYGPAIPFSRSAELISLPVGRCGPKRTELRDAEQASRVRARRK
jgi:hypothetical protein